MNLRVIPALTAALMLTGLCTRASAGTEPKPILIELFTSEGCSSCPPADEFLRKLDSAQPVPGTQLIVLEEHVDYWDDQGWRDPHSSHQFTVRQSSYCARFRVNGPYTPEMVVDGAYEFVGSDALRASDALQKSQLLPSIPVRILSAKAEAGKLSARVETDPAPRKADVLVAVAYDHAESQVKSGENGGHRLEHVAVVKQIVKVGTAEKGKTFSKDVSVAGCGQEACRFIVFLQEPDQGKVIGAALQRVQP